MKTPVGVDRLYWEILAAAQAGQDRLRTSQSVIEVHPVRVYQATLARLDKPLEIAGRAAGRRDPRPRRRAHRRDGHARRASSPRCASTSSSIRTPASSSARRKRSGCSDERLWNAVAGERRQLSRPRRARALLSRSTCSRAATRSRRISMQIALDSGREWPEASLSRMLGGLEAFATGRIVRDSALPTADLTIRKLAAIEALSRHDRAKPQHARFDHDRSGAVADFGAHRLDRDPEARRRRARSAPSA